MGTMFSKYTALAALLLWCAAHLTPVSPERARLMRELNEIRLLRVQVDAGAFTPRELERIEDRMEHRTPAMRTVCASPLAPALRELAGLARLQRACDEEADQLRHRCHGDEP